MTIVATVTGCDGVTLILGFILLYGHIDKRLDWVSGRIETWSGSPRPCVGGGGVEIGGSHVLLSGVTGWLVGFWFTADHE